MITMIKTATRKGKSIDEIISEMPTPLLDIPKVIPFSQNLVSETLQQCGDIVQRYEKDRGVPGISFYEFLKAHQPIKTVLTPEEINVFLQVACDSFPDYAIPFVNLLIQNSYQANHHHFKLNLTHPWDNLCNKLKGTPKTPLVVQMQGRAGDCVGLYTKYCHFFLHAVGELCGYKSEYCRFTIDSAGAECGASAEYCSFSIRKIEATTVRHKARYCSFATSDKETLKLLKREMRRNRVILVEPDGTERIVRDYGDR